MIGVGLSRRYQGGVGWGEGPWNEMAVEDNHNSDLCNQSFRHSWISYSSS